ncbi:MAG: SafA/ExsA family spore coat assembly protein [Firmicutes bacterium]|nr:SafA/ExsA family spore coat assembly protein [Bacillota bacterium]
MSEKNREFQGLGIQFSPTTIPCPNGQLYTVKAGDTLFFIARRYNISLQSLIDANPQITDVNTIFPGQVVCIPTGGQGVTCPNGKTYQVVRGDTMYEIASRNGISLENLIRANPQITNPNLIYPGQEICIPSPQIVAPFVEEPMPLPQPMPTPARPIMPIPCPTPSVPLPISPPMPCPPMERERMPMAPMPFYIQIPWEECPYRDRKKKKHHRKKRCC